MMNTSGLLNSLVLENYSKSPIQLFWMIAPINQRIIDSYRILMGEMYPHSNLGGVMTCTYKRSLETAIIDLKAKLCVLDDLVLKVDEDLKYDRRCMSLDSEKKRKCFPSVDRSNQVSYISNGSSGTVSKCSLSINNSQKKRKLENEKPSSKVPIRTDPYEKPTIELHPYETIDLPDNIDLNERYAPDDINQKQSIGQTNDLNEEHEHSISGIDTTDQNDEAAIQKDEVVLFSAKAKLCRLSSFGWVTCGIGPVKIVKKDTTRIFMRTRNELCNQRIGSILNYCFTKEKKKNYLELQEFVPQMVINFLFERRCEHFQSNI